MKAKRTIRSKAGRYLVLKKFDFKCAMCGCDDLSQLELDHVIPYAITGDTNIHDLQVLCKRCNKKKGAKLMPERRLRKHQARLQQIAREIQSRFRPDIERVYADVTCAGGKSQLPAILFSALYDTRFDYVVWAVPRLSLQSQAEDAFLDPYFRQLLNHSFEIRQSTNEINPARDKNGYVTTYDAVASDKGEINRDFFRKHKDRILLVLDEPHHIYEGSPLEKAFQPLVADAGMTLMMSGTWERHDGKRVSFTPYRGVEKGVWQLDTRDTDTDAWVQYSRREALKERAILETEIVFKDAKGEYRKNGIPQLFGSLTDTDDVRAAIYTVLRTEHAQEMLNEGFAHWLSYKQSHPRSKLLIVAPSLAVADEYKNYITRSLGVAARRVTRPGSDNSAEAVQLIDSFKSNKTGVDVLITVQMAYEGLDVPEITHTIALTHIRSKSWIEQMLARGIRVDGAAGPWERQRHYAWAPDDSLMHQCVDSILADQVAVARDREQGNGGGGGGQVEFTHPVASESTHSKTQNLTNGDGLNAELTAEAIAFQRIANAPEITELSLEVISGALQQIKQGTWKQQRADAAPPKRSSDREQDLKTEIKEYVREYAKQYCANMPNDRQRYDMVVDKTKEINGAIKYCFGKPREVMSEPELKRVMPWLMERYPMKG